MNLWTKLIVSLYTLSILTNCATLQEEPSMSTAKTPLIDRELFFGNPQIIGGKLSPDGKWLSFLKQHNGILNIWLKTVEQPFSAAKLITDSERPLVSYFWTDDSKYIIYAKDNDGDENTSIYAIDLASVKQKTLPDIRNLTPTKEAKTYIYNVSQNNPDLIYLGLNERDPAWHDLYRLSISTGELKRIYTNTQRITSYNFDWDDKLRILSRTDEQGNTEFLRLDAKDKLTPIYQTTVNENAAIAGWTPDNSQFYLLSNKGNQVDLLTLYLMHPISQTITKIESDPQAQVDIGGVSFEHNTRELIATSYTANKTKYYWHNKQWQQMYQYLQQQFPQREVSISGSTNDYSKFLISVWGDKYATEVYLFEPASNKLTFQYTPRPELKPIEQHLVPMQAISYPSRDGMQINAYLSLPSKQKLDLPLVVLVHGGPKGPRDYWGYNNQVQFLANRGYAVLQPNYRASGGYGKKFLNAGDLQWGKLMQDDITWGVYHLINQGIANKNKVVIMGGSYGGYATLAGLAFTPELYAAGIDIVGPSNLFTLLESVPAYWESGRAFLYAMVGDPTTEQGKQRIREASPLFSVDKINRPLMIVQGANDPRVKQAEADQIVVALRDKGKEVSYLLADDEGHGFSKPNNRLAMFAEIEKFLAQVIGTAYQKELPAAIAKRLKELTVDVATVSYQAKSN